MRKCEAIKGPKGQYRIWLVNAITIQRCNFEKLK